MMMTNKEHEEQTEVRYTALKVEFDADPRLFVQKYGTVNSFESGMVVQWLLQRTEHDRSMTKSLARRLASVLGCIECGEMPKLEEDTEQVLLAAGLTKDEDGWG